MIIIIASSQTQVIIRVECLKGIVSIILLKDGWKKFAEKKS
jgi:hypothetical protein